ncbi:MAG: peptidoglycan-binding protein [Candidatus Pararuminococcus gallinarum]
MSYKSTAAKAAEWALSKVGCPYSQAKRTQKNIFDCSSLVARAYDAQGKRWKYGGSVPRSNQEVYDDDFELLWPTAYEKIGKCFGDASVIQLGKQPGDLQFLCTDLKTGRANRITHVTMVIDRDRIVHARGKAYGVCINSLNHYNGKVCAILRYNPSCTLRMGMKGYRTLALQQSLCMNGAALKMDGDFGQLTQEALKKYQKEHRLNVTGKADAATLRALGLQEAKDEPTQGGEGAIGSVNQVLITGGTVNVRYGPGEDFPVAFVANNGDVFEAAKAAGWIPIRSDGQLRWVSARYAQLNMSRKEGI